LDAVASLSFRSPLWLADADDSAMEALQPFQEQTHFRAE